MVDVIVETHHARRNEKRAFSSAIVTLTFSVLPVPYAFSRLGVLLGVLTAVAVSFANSLTGTLLIRAASACGKTNYESLSEYLGGKRWRAGTQAWLVLLLFGTLCGDFALVADTGRLAVSKLAGSSAPTWLTGDHGRVVCTLLGIGLVLPLSCMRHIRKLDHAATVGMALVAVLAAVIVNRAASDGWPAIHSGDLPLARIKITGELPEAVGVLSFAFYVHPMLLPMLAEMPAGPRGAALTAHATQLVTSGIAFVVYVVVGVAAAAKYGSHTAGDVLVNEWLGGVWDGALDAGMALYLSLSMVPIVLTLRLQLDALILGSGKRSSRAHVIMVSSASVLSSLGVALCFPTAAEKMFAITGASAVCVVCYALPIAFHLRLFYRPLSTVAGGAAISHLTAESGVRAALLGVAPGPGAAADASSSVLSLAGWAAAGSPRGSLHSTPERVVSLAEWTEAEDKLGATESGEAEEAPLLAYPSVHVVRREPSALRRAGSMMLHVVLPLVVLFLGLLTSGIGLYLAIQAILS